MPPIQQDDGSEDVADFLERIRGLGERTKEEGERSRNLDEEILQGRREREARRAERARSISPTKDSPVTTPSRQAGQSSMAGTPVSMLSSRPASTMVKPEQRKSTEITLSDKTLPKTLALNLDSEPFMPSPPAENTLSRSGTLSWQQRPSSKIGSRGTTPLLSLDDKPALSPRASNPGSPEPSRADVASALEKKDPNWFKQTADRGIGSAAYRRSQDEPVSRVSGQVQLPGMGYHARDSALSSTKDTPDFVKQGHGSTSIASLALRSKNDSTSPALVSPRPKLETPISSMNNENQDTSSGLAISSSQRNISPERPVSPTKGLGGFVQSAMLKRSDSLNKHKRAGSQAASSLSRSNSILNDQGGTGDGSSDVPRTPIRNSQGSFERGRQAEVPTSPSKTLDTRRWSPTKQSWLEGAISKTDSPRPKSTSIQTPPLWLSELQKSKESGLSVTDISKTTINKSTPSHSASQPPKYSSSSDLDMSEMGSIKNNKLFEMPTQKQDLNKKDSAAKDLTTVGKTPIVAETVTSNTPGNKVPKEADAIESKPTAPAINSPKPENYKATSVVSETAKPMSKATDLDTSKPSTLPEQKAKPDAPVKKDFRAGLRSTRDLDQKPKTEELEFKNVFGKLKKTETKNYVAPDELKDNILRGKTGLSVTGGPRVYQKKDEFKDSILRKKEEMKAGVSSKAKAPEPVEAQPIPEALARRQKLGQKPVTEQVTDSAKTPAETTSELAQTKPTRTPNPNIGIASTGAKPLISPKPDAIRKVSLEKASNSEIKANVTPISPTRTKHSRTLVEEPRMIPLEKKTSAPAQLQSTTTSNTFANRFNPGLASILARGPPQMAGSASGMPRTASPTRIEDDQPRSNSSAGAASTQLSHITKGRAKGPKRRAPGAASAEETKNAPAVTKQASPVLQTKPFVATTTSVLAVSNNFETKKSLPEKMAEATDKSERAATTSDTKPLPVIATKPVTLPSLPTTSMQKNSETTKPDVSIAKSSMQKASDSDSTISMPSKSPVLLQKSPKLPPTPADKAKAMSRIMSNGAGTDRLQIPVSGGILNDFFDNLSTMQNNTDFDAQALLQSPEAAHNEKSRTIKKDTYEISSDGKKSPLAPQQEYVLFEDKMYICRHHLETPDGKQNAEVYLWSGDQVAPAAIEDVQIFCRAEARDAGGKLQLLSQGKEPTSFLDALGGVIVTRRGDSATYMLCGRRRTGRVVFDEVELATESLCSGFPFIIVTSSGSLYIWKGRGANADEIGCARLISMDLSLSGEIEEIEEGSEPAKLHKILNLEHRQASPEYWLHKASTANYASRLFVVDADAKPRPSSSLSNLAVNIWRRRPSAASIADPSEETVKEISPFAQSDLSEDRIFVLDTFFEIWIIVGSRTRLKSSSFVLATTFAQDYGMLSVSVQDRPCLPQSQIVFLGATGTIPISIQTAFRKWDDRLIKQQNSWAPATTRMSIHDALEALETLK